MEKFYAAQIGIDPATLARFEHTTDAALPEHKRQVLEDNKLGPNAKGRKDAADSFLRSALPSNEYPSVAAAVTTAAAVEHIERSMAAVTLKRWYK